MTASDKPAVDDPTTAYATAVVGGVVVAGELVTLACKRHLADLDTGHERGLWFDAVEAQAAFDFWRLCPHLKGRRWAGETIRLEPWEAFIIGSAYGWKRSDGRRRFRVIWIEVARKNGKSTLVYPAGLHGLAVDGEPGAEVYSVATKRDQAKIIFDMARAAVGRSPDLDAIVTRYQFSLMVGETLSKFEPLSADADTLDGLNPSVALCDEVHKWRGRALWDVIETGMGARDQPLMWVTTTAGEEGEQDVYGAEHGYTAQVLRGTVQDDARFGFVATLDAGDDWQDPAVWVKANPNLGVSVQADELADAIRKAGDSPSAANAVKRLRLNVRTQDAAAWLTLTTWDGAADARVSWDALRGLPCFGGLDLASSADFAALALTFPLDLDDAGQLVRAADESKPSWWAYLWRLWIPRNGVSHGERKLREICLPWIKAGWVIPTDGDLIDHGAIKAGVLDATESFDLRGVAFDPFNATMLANELGVEGVGMTAFTQSMGSFNEATTAFETDLTNGRMRHDGNPCVRWMADNAILVQNGAGQRMPSRKKSRNKIDGIVAAVMARGRAMAGGGGRSFYETNGVEVV